jgi:hypothetical protein
MPQSRINGKQPDRQTMRHVPVRRVPELVLLQDVDLLLRQWSEQFDVPSSRPSTRVAVVLASRLSDDLHAFSLLIRRYYRAQAMTIAASAVEAAWTIIHVGTSDERASEWETHSRVKDTKWPISKLSKASRREDEQWHRDIYSLFCAAKHHNPNVLRLFGTSSTFKGHRLESDPSFSAPAGQIRFFVSLLLSPVLDALSVLCDHEEPSEQWSHDLDRASKRLERALPETRESGGES